MFKFKYKREALSCMAAFLAAFMLSVCSVGTVAAVENTTTEATGENGEEKSKTPGERVPRKSGEKPTIHEGEAGILIDPISGRTLFEKDSTKKMYPASTTKIMTALLTVEAVERGEISLEDMVTVTPEMLADADPDGSNIALKVGEVMKLDYLLKGMMVASGNDAACAIATYISGSIEEFAELMNSRAAEIGANDTHFINPHGLHNEQHYTTAADMAKIARAAMKQPDFSKIADIAHIKIPPTNVTDQERYYINTNGLLSTLRHIDYYYEGATGIKTGYTGDAGNCLVSSAKRDGVELIAVLFGGIDLKHSHLDSSDMLDWGFEEFKSAVVVAEDDMVCEIKVRQGKGTDSLTLSAKNTVNVVIPKDVKAEELEIKPEIPEAVYAPIEAEAKVGNVAILLNGEELGRGELVATKTIERSMFWPVMAFAEWVWNTPLARVVLFVIIAAILLFILLFITAIHNNVKKAKRRRR